MSQNCLQALGAPPWHARARRSAAIAWHRSESRGHAGKPPCNQEDLHLTNGVASTRGYFQPGASCLASGTAVAAQARPGRGRCQRRDHSAARRSIARRPNIRAGEAREGLPRATVFRRDGRGGAPGRVLDELRRRPASRPRRASIFYGQLVYYTRSSAATPRLRPRLRGRPRLLQRPLRAAGAGRHHRPGPRRRVRAAQRWKSPARGRTALVQSWRLGPSRW